MGRLVIYDDRCGFCLKSVRWLQHLDTRGVHRYEGSSNEAILRQTGITADEADRELKLVANGEVYGGFDAVREVLRALPASSFWAPLLGLPPIRWIGRRVYRAVASRRKCTYTPVSPPQP